MPRKTNPSKRSPFPTLRRRAFLAGAAAASFPHIWIPKPAFAQQCTGRGGVKHLVYIRLNGGFRFTTAFNADVGAIYNPFGVASGLASGTEWGVSKLFEAAPWLDDAMGGQARRDLGMKPVTSITNEMTVLATVDHEPGSGNADGNHGTGLERFLTGHVNGDNSIFTMLNYGLRAKIEAAAAEGRVELPPFVLGSSGMALGAGKYAAFRPPLIQGDSFENFVFSDASKLPMWATDMAGEVDARMHARVAPRGKPSVEAYIASRESTAKFAAIFGSDILRIGNRSNDAVDGISNQELSTIFGDSGSGRQLALALRLFHFGCPAVYLDQGGYDMHSNEDENLPESIADLGLLLSGLNAALKRMTHPDGGTYWDHTLVVMGSEFGRTTRGTPFNSAGGSDHGGDRATRWMSMPFMGGIVTASGMGGKQYGVTEKSELKDDGRVYSYRAVAKTLMDLLCADHSEFFPEDPPIADIF
jgi:uncharacterized protein (DUF1501 family)